MDKEFKSIKEFTKGAVFEELDDNVKALITNLFDKIEQCKEIDFKVSLRDKNNIILIPDEIIKANRAYKGMKHKNILTIVCKKVKNSISIEIERKDKSDYEDASSITESVISRIKARYRKLITLLQSDLSVLKEY